MGLKSWECKGCTNVCYRIVNGEVFEYCRPVIEKGKNRTKWIGDYVACLDYTTDPKKTDQQIKYHDCNWK